jgi:hypothetical protein
MAHSGLQHISSIFVNKDIPSLQQWLKKMERNTHVMYTDDKPKKAPFVPLEMKGRMTKNAFKKNDKEPDWKGTFMFRGEVITFGAWQNDAGHGPYFNLKINDPDWNKQKQQYPREVRHVDAGDVPF